MAVSEEYLSIQHDPVRSVLWWKRPRHCHSWQDYERWSQQTLLESTMRNRAVSTTSDIKQLGGQSFVEGTHTHASVHMHVHNLTYTRQWWMYIFIITRLLYSPPTPLTKIHCGNRCQSLFLIWEWTLQTAMYHQGLDLAWHIVIVNIQLVNYTHTQKKNIVKHPHNRQSFWVHHSSTGAREENTSTTHTYIYACQARFAGVSYWKWIFPRMRYKATI